jgi:hypothetical protein
MALAVLNCMRCVPKVVEQRSVLSRQQCKDEEES